MKKIISLIIICSTFTVFCFAEDEIFVEEQDIELLTEKQYQDDSELSKEKELEILKKQNDVEISKLQYKINQEEDGIVRIELENQIKAQKIDFEAKQDMLSWIDISNTTTISQALQEAKTAKKQTTFLLDKFDALLEANNEAFFEEEQNLTALYEQSIEIESVEEKNISSNKNKILSSMIKTMKPFIDRLNSFQKQCFSSTAQNKVKINYVGKLDATKKYFNIRIIYNGELPVIYDLKYNCKDINSDNITIMLNNPKKFSILPVFSVTENNSGDVAKILTGFNVKHSDTNIEKIIKIKSNVKEFSEIVKYKKTLKQYNIKD